MSAAVALPPEPPCQGLDLLAEESVSQWLGSLREHDQRWSQFTENLLAEIEALSEEVTAKAQRVADQQLRLDAQREQLHQQQADIARQQQEIEQWRQACQMREESLAQVLTELAEARVAISDLATAQQLRVEENESLGQRQAEQQRRELTQKLDDTCRERAQLEGELESVRAAHAELADRAERLQAEHGASQTRWIQELGRLRSLLETHVGDGSSRDSRVRGSGLRDSHPSPETAQPKFDKRDDPPIGKSVQNKPTAKSDVVDSVQAEFERLRRNLKKRKTKPGN